MEKEYWQQFTSTGSVEDYLSYRMETEKDGLKKEDAGVRKRESDCTDRNGAVYGSRWGI